MSKRYRRGDISQITDRGIFFDANVLLYLFWPTHSHWVRIYSSIYKDLLISDFQSYVNFSVISEVVNRAIRLEYENYLRIHSLKRNNCNYKQYRKSDDGQQTILDVYKVIQYDILNKFSITGKCFTENDINNMLSNTDIDINDKAIEVICQENNFILLTNDSDFKNSSLDILSENKSLI